MLLNTDKSIDAKEFLKLLSDENDQIKELNDALKNQNGTLQNQKDILQEENKILALRNAQLEEIVRYLKGEKFASKSEKLSDDQLHLFSRDQKLKDQEESKEEVIQSYSRKKTGRKPLPKDLPVEKIEHDLNEEDKQCPCGCGEMKRIGEDVSEQLHHIPAQYKIIQHVRFKYACPVCEEGVYRATLPLSILPKSNATPDLLAHIVVSKIQDALPLYRQEKIFKRHGIDLPRATMANWILKVGRKVQPIVNLILDHLLDSDYIGMDETTFQVLKEPGRKAQSKSYMWVIRGGPPNQMATYFQYDPSRSQKVLEKIIEDFKGYLQSDAYQCYINIGTKPEITLLACMAHVRRGFYKAYKAGKNNPNSVAAQGIRWIKKLYDIEHRVKEEPVDKIFQIRQKESIPLLNEIKKWLDDEIVQVLPSSLTGKALHYMNKNWDNLIRYTDRGDLKIDNNLTENAIRPFVVGRKNWMFANTPNGAHALANLFTIIETAKNNSIEPYQYLRILFHMLPLATCLEEFENLLPWNLGKSLA